jgi:hypothetical protein
MDAKRSLVASLFISKLIFSGNEYSCGKYCIKATRIIAGKKIARIDGKEAEKRVTCLLPFFEFWLKLNRDLQKLKESHFPSHFFTIQKLFLLNRKKGILYFTVSMKNSKKIF